MDCPILEVVQDRTQEEFFHLLKKYGKCSDFLSEKVQKCAKKNSIFVGSVYAAHKLKINKREDGTQCIIVLILSNLIKGPHEYTLFRVAFIGRVVKDIIHLQKGDLLGILNPKFFFVMSSDKKIPSLAVGPHNVVLWICRSKKVDNGAKAVNTELRILSDSSDENDSCLSLSTSKDNRTNIDVLANYKEINKPMSQTSMYLSKLSNRNLSLKHKLSSFSKNLRGDNVFPSENTTHDGSIIDSNSCINFVNKYPKVVHLNSSMPKSTRNDCLNQLSHQCNNHNEVSNQSHSSRQNFKSFSKNLGVDNLCNNHYSSENTAQVGSIVNLNSCSDSVNTCHKVNQINSSVPRSCENEHSSHLSYQFNDHKTGNSCNHNSACKCCLNRLSNCEFNASCCPQASGHCRKVSPCYPKSLFCSQFSHHSHTHCRQISCICNHSDNGTNRSDCSRGDTHGRHRTHFFQEHRENPPQSFTNELSKTCSCFPHIFCCRPIICSHIMAHCSRFPHVSSSHKSPCNWKKSFCLPENTCHAVSSNCCCNCSLNNCNKCLRHCPFKVNSPHNKVAQDQEDQDISRSFLNKESIIRTQDWVKQWQPPDINIPQNCEPICIESSSSSTASFNSMQAQNIIKPALNVICLNNNSSADCSLDAEPKISNVKKKRKLFNPSNNSIVIEERSPETVIDESTPFNSEQSDQNPSCLPKHSSEVVSLDNQISTTVCGQNNENISVNLHKSSKEANMGKCNSHNCGPLANKQNDNQKNKSFPDNEKDARNSQEAAVCSTIENDTVIINNVVNSFPDLNLKLSEIKSNTADSTLATMNNPNSFKNVERNINVSFQLEPNDLKNDKIIISDENTVLDPLKLVNTLKKRKDVPSLSEKSSDEIELFSEKTLKKSKRLKSVDDSFVRSESPKSDKSNETIDLVNETTKLFSPSKNPEKHLTADRLSKLEESVTTFSSPSCGQSFYDALSTQSSIKESQDRWIIKPISEATEYLSTAEKLYEMKATPRQNVKPISLKLYETFSVKGVIINMIPDLGDKFSIIQGFCHGKCKQPFKYEEFSFLEEIKNFSCTACRYHVHYECPKCHEAGLHQPLCLFYSFEIHLLVGDCVLRIEVDHQDAVDFLGCTPATYLRCSGKISQKLKKIITTTPPKNKKLVVLLSANVRPKSKKGLTVLGIHKTCLSKHLTVNGAIYKYYISK